MDRESIVRRVLMGLGVVLSVVVAFGFVTVGWVASEMPPAQAERVRGPHGLVGIRANATYSWIVPTDGGVVLVDAGMEPGGRAILAEVGTRPVRAILLTHAHADHLMGLDAFPGVPVHVHPDDAPILRGEREPGGWLAAAIGRYAGEVPRPETIEALPEGELVIDGARFHVVPVPGHTSGSVAYLWEDVLFSGDAVWGGQPMSPAPPALSDDVERARKSLIGLVPLDFDAMADGHVGLTSHARPALLHLLEQPGSEPRVSVRSDAAGPRSRPVTRTGVLVRAPAPDVRGEQPELLLIEGEPAWRLSTRPDPSRDALVGQRVVVRARPGLGGGGPGVPMEPMSVTLAEGEPPAAQPTTLAGLSASDGWWVPVSGAIEDFAPLEPGAAWGEGRLVLPDGARVSLSAPVARIAGATTVEGTARVHVTAAGPRLTLVDGAPPVP